MAKEKIRVYQGTSTPEPLIEKYPFMSFSPKQHPDRIIGLRRGKDLNSSRFLFAPPLWARWFEVGVYFLKSNGMKFETLSDMGSIKIFNETMSVFFDNKFGDSRNRVEVFDKPTRQYPSKRFAGHFTVKSKAFLSSYDCSDEPLHEFKRGSWFVYLVKPLHFVIEREDGELHA